MNKCYNFEKITTVQVVKTEFQLKESLIGNRQFINRKTIKLSGQIGVVV
jgi:hypothetical protein